jgi:hypothetical protein
MIGVLYFKIAKIATWRELQKSSNQVFPKIRSENRISEFVS